MLTCLGKAMTGHRNPASRREQANNSLLDNKSLRAGAQSFHREIEGLPAEG